MLTTDRGVRAAEEDAIDERATKEYMMDILPSVLKTIQKSIEQHLSLKLIHQMLRMAHFVNADDTVKLYCLRVVYAFTPLKGFSSTFAGAGGLAFVLPFLGILKSRLPSLVAPRDGGPGNTYSTASSALVRSAIRILCAVTGDEAIRTEFREKGGVASCVELLETIVDIATSQITFRTCLKDALRLLCNAIVSGGQDQEQDADHGVWENKEIWLRAVAVTSKVGYTSLEANRAQQQQQQPPDTTPRSSGGSTGSGDDTIILRYSLACMINLSSYKLQSILEGERHSAFEEAVIKALELAFQVLVASGLNQSPRGTRGSMPQVQGTGDIESTRYAVRCISNWCSLLELDNEALGSYFARRCSALKVALMRHLDIVPSPSSPAGVVLPDPEVMCYSLASLMRLLAVEAEGEEALCDELALDSLILINTDTRKDPRFTQDIQKEFLCYVAGILAALLTARPTARSKLAEGIATDRSPIKVALYDGNKALLTLPAPALGRLALAKMIETAFDAGPGLEGQGRVPEEARGQAGEEAHVLLQKQCLAFLLALVEQRQPSSVVSPRGMGWCDSVSDVTVDTVMLATICVGEPGAPQGSPFRALGANLIKLSQQTALLYQQEAEAGRALGEVVGLETDLLGYVKTALLMEASGGRGALSSAVRESLPWLLSEAKRGRVPEVRAATCEVLELLGEGDRRSFDGARTRLTESLWTVGEAEINVTKSSFSRDINSSCSRCTDAQAISQQTPLTLSVNRSPRGPHGSSLSFRQGVAPDAATSTPTTTTTEALERETAQLRKELETLRQRVREQEQAAEKTQHGVKEGGVDEHEVISDSNRMIAELRAELTALSGELERQRQEKEVLKGMLPSPTGSLSNATVPSNPPGVDVGTLTDIELTTQMEAEVERSIREKLEKTFVARGTAADVETTEYIGTMKAELARMYSAVDALHSAKAKLEESNKGLETRCAAAEAQAVKIQADAAAREIERQSQAAARAIKQLDNPRGVVEIEQLRTDLNLSREREEEGARVARDLRKEMEEASRSRDTQENLLREEMREVREELERSRRDNNKLRQQMVEQEAARVRENEERKRLLNLGGGAGDDKSLPEGAKIELCSLRNRCRELEQRCKDSAALELDANNKVGELHQEITALASNNTELESVISTLKTRLESAETERDSLYRATHGDEGEGMLSSGDAVEQNKALKTQLERVKRELADARESDQEANGFVIRLKKKVVELEEELKLVTANKAVKPKVVVGGPTGGVVSSLNVDAKAGEGHPIANTNSNSVPKDNSVTKKALAQATTNIKELETEIAMMAATMKARDLAAAELEENLSSVKGELERSRAECKILEGHLATKQRALQGKGNGALEASLQAAEDELGARERFYSAKLREAESKIKKLEGEVSTLTSQQQQHQQHNIKQAGAQGNSPKQVVALLEHSKQLEAEVNAVGAEGRRLLAQREEEIAKLRKQNEEARQELQGLGVNADEKTKRCSELLKLVEALKLEKKQLEEELGKVESFYKDKLNSLAVATTRQPSLPPPPPQPQPTTTEGQRRTPGLPQRQQQQQQGIQEQELTNQLKQERNKTRILNEELEAVKSWARGIEAKHSLLKARAKAQGVDLDAASPADEKLLPLAAPKDSRDTPRQEESQQDQTKANIPGTVEELQSKLEDTQRELIKTKVARDLEIEIMQNELKLLDGKMRRNVLLKTPQPASLSSTTRVSHSVSVSPQKSKQQQQQDNEMNKRQLTKSQLLSTMTAPLAPTPPQEPRQFQHQPNQQSAANTSQHFSIGDNTGLESTDFVGDEDTRAGLAGINISSIASTGACSVMSTQLPPLPPMPLSASTRRQSHHTSTKESMRSSSPPGVLPIPPPVKCSTSQLHTRCIASTSQVPATATTQRRTPSTNNQLSDKTKAGTSFVDSLDNQFVPVSLSFKILDVRYEDIDKQVEVYTTIKGLVVEVTRLVEDKALLSGEVQKLSRALYKLTGLVLENGLNRIKAFSLDCISLALHIIKAAQRNAASAYSTNNVSDEFIIRSNAVVLLAGTVYVFHEVRVSPEYSEEDRKQLRADHVEAETRNKIQKAISKEIRLHKPQALKSGSKIITGSENKSQESQSTTLPHFEGEYEQPNEQVYTLCCIGKLVGVYPKCGILPFILSSDQSDQTSFVKIFMMDSVFVKDGVGVQERVGQEEIVIEPLELSKVEFTQLLQGANYHCDATQVMQSGVEMSVSTGGQSRPQSQPQKGWALTDKGVRVLYMLLGTMCLVQDAPKLMASDTSIVRLVIRLANVAMSNIDNLIAEDKRSFRRIHLHCIPKICVLLINVVVSFVKPDVIASNDSLATSLLHALERVASMFEAGEVEGVRANIDLLHCLTVANQFTHISIFTRPKTVAPAPFSSASAQIRSVCNFLQTQSRQNPPAKVQYFIDALSFLTPAKGESFGTVPAEYEAVKSLVIDMLFHVASLLQHNSWPFAADLLGHALALHSRGLLPRDASSVPELAALLFASSVLRFNDLLGPSQVLLDGLDALGSTMKTTEDVAERVLGKIVTVRGFLDTAVPKMVEMFNDAGKGDRDPTAVFCAIMDPLLCLIDFSFSNGVAKQFLDTLVRHSPTLRSILSAITRVISRCTASPFVVSELATSTRLLKTIIRLAVDAGYKVDVVDEQELYKIFETIQNFSIINTLNATLEAHQDALVVSCIADLLECMLAIPQGVLLLYNIKEEDAKDPEKFQGYEASGKMMEKGLVTVSNTLITLKGDHPLHLYTSICKLVTTFHRLLRYSDSNGLAKYEAQSEHVATRIFGSTRQGIRNIVSLCNCTVYLAKHLVDGRAGKSSAGGRSSAQKRSAGGVREQTGVQVTDDPSVGCRCVLDAVVCVNRFTRELLFVEGMRLVLSKLFVASLSLFSDKKATDTPGCDAAEIILNLCELARQADSRQIEAQQEKPLLAEEIHFRAFLSILERVPPTSPKAAVVGAALIRLLATQASDEKFSKPMLVTALLASGLVDTALEMALPAGEVFTSVLAPLLSLVEVMDMRQFGELNTRHGLLDVVVPRIVQLPQQHLIPLLSVTLSKVEATALSKVGLVEALCDAVALCVEVPKREAGAASRLVAVVCEMLFKMFTAKGQRNSADILAVAKANTSFTAAVESLTRGRPTFESCKRAAAPLLQFLR